MKKSELAAFIKEEIKSVIAKEATIETSPEDLAKVKQTADKDDVIKVTEDYSVFKNYDDIIGGIQVRFGALEDYVQDKEPGAMDDLQKVMRAFEIFDEKMTYGAHMELEEDEEDAPAGDAEIEKKATKQDQIIKNYQNLQKELKKHLEAYKESKSEEEKQSHLKDMKRISQSAEYLDAKAKYEKLKKIK